MQTHLPTVLLALALAGCGARVWEPSLHPAGEPPPAAGDETPWLKAHLASGGLVVFSTWSADGAGGLSGQGTRYDPQRQVVAAGPVALPADSVVLLESNREDRVGEFPHGLLVAQTGLTAAVTLSCVADPKACFGSCPTFYLLDGAEETLVAEGFSASFARVLEAVDLDAIPTPGPGADRRVRLLMRNEAPETHAVRRVRLRAVLRGDGASIVATGDGRLFRASSATAPLGCRVDGADCLDAVLRADGTERFTGADAGDLGTKEILELEFPAPDGEGELALALRARNSLLSTFVFYRTIAALGEDAGAWLAEMERGRPEFVERSLGLARELGPIEVRIADAAGAWQTVGTFDEAGPIAADEQVVPLGRADGPVRVRLVMTRGNWRIDRAALVRLGAAAEPIVLEPTAVEAVARGGGGGPADPEAALLDPERHLVTGRGDAYLLTFDLPDRADLFALFLESEGWYYEWIRPEWRSLADPALARLVFTDPGAALRRLAPEYAEREREMEAAFWSSRFRGEGR